MALAGDKLKHVCFNGVAKKQTTSEKGRLARVQRAAEVTSSRNPTLLSPEERRFLQEVLRRAGVEVHAYRMSALGRRIPACLRTLGVASLVDALKLINRDEKARALALNTILIGVTSFFRDAEPFHHLRALMRSEKQEQFSRILSVACSDGAELYSLAMVLADEDRLTNTSLCGIDCRRDAVTRAASGHFAESAAAGLSVVNREKYFHRTPSGYQAGEQLRQGTQWECGDAFAWVPPHPFDMIACRNFSIYLEPVSANRIWLRLHGMLRPQGVLFVGKAERPGAGFVRIAPSLFRKVSL